jgi:hypothetical protein
MSRWAKLGVYNGNRSYGRHLLNFYDAHNTSCGQLSNEGKPFSANGRGRSRTCGACRRQRVAIERTPCRCKARDVFKVWLSFQPTIAVGRRPVCQVGFFWTEVPNGLDLFPKHMLSGGAPQVEIDAQDAAFVERNLTSLTSGAKACLWRCIRTEYGTCCENQTAPAQLLFSRESTTDPRSIRR